jgi:hypothetical protein
MWIMTTLDPQKGLETYQKRTKIEESFRDLKDKLHLEKVMNKNQDNLEKMIALTMIAYVVGIWFGKAERFVTSGWVPLTRYHPHPTGWVFPDLASKEYMASLFWLVCSSQPKIPPT